MRPRAGASKREIDPEILRALPQPLHLFTALTESNHYHFGQFVEPGDSITTATHRMTVACAARLPAGCRVLDVGCGLGGSTRILFRLGHSSVGIDPCDASIRFARANGESADLTFEAKSFTEATDGAEAGEAFEGLLFLEVLQHFASLDDLLDRALSVSAPGATMVFGDLFTIPDLPREAVPYHRQGTLIEAAQARQLQVAAHRPVTSRVMPTLEHVLSRLRWGRARLISIFEVARPRIREEIEELEDQCRVLRSALENGDLVYEMVVLRRP